MISSYQFNLNGDGHMINRGQFYLYILARAKDYTVLPTPISSAIKILPLNFNPYLTQSLWYSYNVSSSVLSSYS